MRRRWRSLLLVGLLVLLAGAAPGHWGWQRAEAVRRALGSDRPLTYLVLAQTSDELRATGGFISSVGTIRVERGRIAAARFEKVYAAEGVDSARPTGSGLGRYVQPPMPFSRYMGIGPWLLRDANWWSDFPSTARQAARFWENARSERVDGVIAFDEDGLAAVLEAFGPLRLADGTLIDAGNVKAAALRAVFVPGSARDWYASQSIFSQELGRAIVDAAQRLPPDRLLAAALRLRASAARHDILVASFEPGAAALLRELGLDGALQGERDDYLYLVESNVGYSKLSPFIRQDLDYAVELGPDARPTHAWLVVDAANTYDPAGREAGYPASYYIGFRWNRTTRRLDSWEGYYGGYTRLYLPAGSRVARADGFDDGPRVGAESERVVVGGYTGLWMGDRRRARFEWTPEVDPSRPGVYRLLVQRQPGAPAHALTVRVVLPPGYVPAQMSPSPVSFTERVITWRAVLDRDLAFEIILRSAPR